MKANNIFRNFIAKAIATVATIMLALNLSSCASSDYEPQVSADEAITSATVTFTYKVPQELFNYAEITVCYNNDEGTDAKWEPMLSNEFTVTYDLRKFPITAPVVMVYDTTNRPAGGVNVDWNLEMDVKVIKTVGGRTEVETNHEAYTINGDLGKAITALQRNVIDRTYAVKIAKNGNVQYVK